MRSDSWHDVKIAGWPSPNPRFTFAPQPNTFSSLGTRRDIDPHRLRPHDPSASATGRAWIPGQLSSSVAARTSDAKLERPLNYLFAAGAATLRACSGGAPRFSSRTMTSFAFDMSLQGQRGLKTTHGVEEIDIHRRFDILAASRARRCSPGAPKHAA